MLAVELGHFPGGIPYIEYLPTLEMDPFNLLIPDGLGGVKWNPALIELLRTTELDPTKVLVPDGAGGLQWIPAANLGGAVLMWGCFSITDLETPLYLAPGYGADSVATSVAIEMRSPRAGVLKNLHIRQSIIVGSPTQTVTYTVLKNGTPTSLQTSIILPAQDGDDSSHTVSVAKGDRITVLVSKSAKLTTGSNVFGVVVTAEFD